MSDTRHISLEVGDPPVRRPVTVSLCAASASIDFNKTVVHIPWTEIAEWIAWAAEKLQEKE
jgi:hypothetical protein